MNDYEREHLHRLREANAGCTVLLNEKVKDAVPSLAIFCEEGLADRPATWPANSTVDGSQEAQTTAAKAKNGRKQRKQI